MALYPRRGSNIRLFAGTTNVMDKPSRLSRRTSWPTLYKIVNTVTGDFYVGSAWRPMERFYHHWRMLKAGKHANIILQRAANKYGWWNFQFETIRSWAPDEVDRKTLYRLEQQYINTLDPLYNISREVGAPVVSEEAKEKFKRLYSKTWIVTDPSGVERTIANLKQFCRDNKLSFSQLWYVAQGKMSHSHGWKCRYADGSTPVYTNKSEREYLITLPDGTEKRVRNLTRFCTENALAYTSMMNILMGDQRQHKGYRIRKVPEQERKDSFHVWN